MPSSFNAMYDRADCQHLPLLQAHYPEAYAITYWSHTWGEDKAGKEEKKAAKKAAGKAKEDSAGGKAAGKQKAGGGGKAAEHAAAVVAAAAADGAAAEAAQMSDAAKAADAAAADTAAGAAADAAAGQVCQPSCTTATTQAKSCNGDMQSGTRRCCRLRAGDPATWFLMMRADSTLMFHDRLTTPLVLFNQGLKQALFMAGCRRQTGRDRCATAPTVVVVEVGVVKAKDPGCKAAGVESVKHGQVAFPESFCSP